MANAGHIQRAIIRRRTQLGDYKPLPYPPRGGCDGASPSVVAAVGKGALAVAPLTGPAAPFVAIFGALATLFGGSHAKKVAEESQILCAAVPAANQALEAIYQGVKSGQTSPQDGAVQLDQLVSQFSDAVKAINKGTFGTGNCNGACLYKGWLVQAVQQQKADFSKTQPQSLVQQSLVEKSMAPFSGVPWWGWALGAAAAVAILI